MNRRPPPEPAQAPSRTLEQRAARRGQGPLVRVKTQKASDAIGRRSHSWVPRADDTLSLFTSILFHPDSYCTVQAAGAPLRLSSVPDSVPEAVASIPLALLAARSRDAVHNVILPRRAFVAARAPLTAFTARARSATQSSTFPAVPTCRCGRPARPRHSFARPNEATLRCTACIRSASNAE